MSTTAKTSMAEELAESDLEAVAQLKRAYERITAEIGKVIVGQQEVVDELLMALLAGGHVLLVGVPGLAKTLMVQTLAQTLDLSFKRVQFTPDLMPSDITGTEVIQENRSTGEREFKFLPGPVFANVVLADEINRTPPKTQAALLEAMQERHVTVGGVRHSLPQPFFVLATQNPIEQEGTYPLPEAQLDRFMFNIRIAYPSEEEEFQIVRQTTTDRLPQVDRVLTHEELEKFQHLVRRVPVADHVIRFAMRFSRSTRRQEADAPDFVKSYVSWGAGPRASQALILAAKAKAVLAGKSCVGTADILEVVLPVLRHRVITNFNAEAEGIDPDEVIRRLVKAIPPAGG
jgi:MoxR-like ATPase